jgi:hypothetical protein
MKQSIAFALLCTFFSLSSPVAYAQDFSSIDNDLQTLEKSGVINRIKQELL